jgi:hypothetical protein
MHCVTGYNAFLYNLRIAYLALGGLETVPFLSSLLLQVSSLWLGGMLLVGFSMAFWWFGTWGYLWCREMFEGTTENAKETTKKGSHAHAAA